MASVMTVQFEFIHSFRQASQIARRPMTYGINQFLLFTAFAASIAIHGVALAFWNNSFFSEQNTILQIESFNRSAAINTITVTLGVLPSQNPDKKQNHLQISNEQNISTEPSLKKITRDKSIKSLLPQKSTALDKPASDNKNSKLPHQASKPVNRRPAKKQDNFIDNFTNQRYEELKKLASYDNSDPLNAKSTTQAIKPSVTQPVDGNNNDQALNKKQSSSLPQLAALKLTNNSPASHGELPPLLRSRQPEYPEEARWEERIGKVMVKFKISERGRVLDPQVANSSGHRDLDLAAIQAIQFWQFDSKGEQADKQWFHYSFRFELN